MRHVYSLMDGKTATSTRMDLGVAASMGDSLRHRQAPGKADLRRYPMDALHRDDRMP